MQAFTIFFGLAIVAIAMENFTAKFLVGKTSDASAKGHREIQSRATNEMKYRLRGETGTEKVIIRDGNKKPKTVNLKKKDQEFVATNPKITIEYINDECCEPTDKNVLFTPDYPYRISTSNNNNNYFENWNCSLCSTSNSRKIKKQMDLQSRSEKQDRCWETREPSVDDCTKCSLVKDGQFCYPGNYTVEFKTENQCENVTYGGCDLEHMVLKNETLVNEERKCAKFCRDYTECVLYRYNDQTETCFLMKAKYRKEKCNINSGPTDKTSTGCLLRDSDKICDSILEEDCEYNGELLDTLGGGQILTPDACQDWCELKAPYCKYWIYHIKEAECILKRSADRTCKIKSGVSMDINVWDTCDKKFRNPSNN